MMNTQDHWNAIYGTKGERDVSWFEAIPAVSLQMIEAAGLGPETCVVDIGAGQSRLVDALVARGVDCLAVLDVSAKALQQAQARMGNAAPTVTWIEADVTGTWSLKPMDIWHDRAVFHFLTTPGQRAGYLARLRETLKPMGSAIIATFAPDGPERCSGLPVVRYSPETLSAELGEGFTLVEAARHVHVTPWGTEQPFQYSRFVRVPVEASQGQMSGTNAATATGSPSTQSG
jgi:SAM-dependent methyltransferase